MQISEQVITLEQAKKLKELGFKKESLYVFVEGGKIGQPTKSEIHLTEIMKNRICLADSAYSLYQAYTVSELMEYLPEYIGDYYIGVFKDYTQYCCHYVEVENNTTLHQSRNDNLAQALGDVLIYLISNNYMECN